MRQLAMVMDLNKCLGCQTCTMACKTQWTNRNGREYMYWNNVETQPGKGYPRNYMNLHAGWNKDGTLKTGELPDLEKDYGSPWDYNYEEMMTGASDTLKPDKQPTWGPNWDEEQGAGKYPNAYYFYLPRICNHCTNPACLAACPQKAIRKREEDGIVLVDLTLCRGFRLCIRSCPYKKVYFNHALLNKEKNIIGQSEKCIFCYPRVEKGIPPACAKQCVGRIRHVSFLEDEDGPVYKLAVKWKVALPLRADFGTIPNVFYVPPLSPPAFDKEGNPTDKPRIPDDYLEYLFGAEVKRVLETLKSETEKKSKGEKSEIMDTLIAFEHKKMFRL